ncbi:hypothetical protein TcasGA2_TC006078 [Tribolium castaneum]|uniref:PiggyBac transposable element-derived protein domain-containing protein n=1 Tax=Tribolium castaneum TaxID=7070 RepID=D6WYM6_TRICA|nr:hypothetical protein TcasGA2_TC006078 [Tribolium castaneum]
MMSKMGRGASEQLLREDEKIIIVKWYDMKPVLLASTGQGSQPYDECKRWSKKEAKYIQVPRPNIVSKYNECMGGIDLIDRMISYYRIQARCKKWTVRVILHFFDLAMANSWILYRRDKKRLNTTNRNIQQYLDFKIEFATYLLSDQNDFFMDLPRSLSTRANSKGRVDSPKVCDSPTLKRNRHHFPAIASIKNSDMTCAIAQKIKVPLDNVEETVLEVLHPVIISGHDIPESQVSFIFEKETATAINDKDCISLNIADLDFIDENDVLVSNEESEHHLDPINLNTSTQQVTTIVLQNSAEATTAFSKNMDRKLALKEDYYKQKLILLKEKNELKLQQVNALSRIAYCLENLNKKYS